MSAEPGDGDAANADSTKPDSDERGHRSALKLALTTIFSGIAGVLLTLWLGHDTVAVQTVTKTVRAPPIIQYRYQTIGGARPCSGSRVASGAPFEPNGLVSEAYGPLKAKVPYDAALDDSGDVDFYAFCLGDRGTVDVRVEQTSACRGCDFYGVTVKLLDNKGVELVSGTFESDQSLLTLSTRLPSGRYFVRLADGGLDPERYELTLYPHRVALRSSLPPEP